jgi:hypothetical protein
MLGSAYPIAVRRQRPSAAFAHSYFVVDDQNVASNLNHRLPLLLEAALLWDRLEHVVKRIILEKSVDDK